MHCLACDALLSDREASRKYLEPEKIKNPEDRYIMLCDGCMRETDLAESFPIEEEISDEELFKRIP